VRLFDLDGHADGQAGALLHLGSGRRCFLLADAFWARQEIESKLKPTLGFRVVADNFKAALASRKAIIEIAEHHPEIELVCTHCPEFAKAQAFDEQLENVLK